MILHDICQKINKMPEFYMLFARKIFFTEFWGHMPPSFRLLRLCFVLKLICTKYNKVITYWKLL